MRYANQILNSVQLNYMSRATQPPGVRRGWNGVAPGSGRAVHWERHILPLGDAAAAGLGLCHAGNGAGRVVQASAVWGA